MAPRAKKSASGRVYTDDPQVLEVVEDALQNLWHTANELARVTSCNGERYRVTIFGSARIRQEDPLYQQVRELARRLSAEGCDILTGGGPGLMEAANAGAQLGDPEQLRESVGIRVELPFEQGANSFVEKTYTHKTFFTRLHHFARLSHAFVVVGGGIGTTLETLMIWQLLQVRHLHDVPLVFVGEMWSDLVSWARKHMLATEPPLAGPEDLAIPVCVDTADEACKLLVPKVRAYHQRAAAKAQPATAGLEEVEG